LNIHETKAFDKCIDMIIEWRNLDHSEQSKQLIRDSKFDQLYLGPCKRELSKIIMFLDEPERDKLIIVTIKELLSTVDKGYVKNRRNTRSDYVDSGYNAAMSLDEYLIREDKAYAYSDMISHLQICLFIDILYICREYKILIENILKDLKIDLNDYFTVDARRFYTGNKGFPKPKIKIRTEYRPFLESTKTQITPSPQQREDKPEQLNPVIRPTFKPEAILTIFHELKDFFKPEQQAQLLEILTNGNNAGEKLLFRDNSNRLTDTFKKLIEHDFITGCPKKVLRDWICMNFEFQDGELSKPFNSDTVTRTLSGGKAPCKSPLIEVIDGKITRTLLPRQKNYNNN
jgi:hypothetical protein